MMEAVLHCSQLQRLSIQCQDKSGVYRDKCSRVEAAL
jgi:hypothetical protein